MRRGFLNSYTGWIIIVNVAVFLVFLVLAGFYGEGKVVEWIALQPANIFQGKFVWTFITSMFMHAGIGHLFVNMVSLLFIGGFVEKLIGKKRYLGLYLVSGLFAGILFVVLAGFFGGSEIGSLIFGSPMAFAVGASGAIFGIGGLLAVLTPRLKVLLFFVIPMPMWIAMIFLLGVLWVLSFSLGIPVGNTAHLGGLIVGVGYGFYLKNKYPRKAAMISRQFS